VEGRGGEEKGREGRGRRRKGKRERSRATAPKFGTLSTTLIKLNYIKTVDQNLIHA
jgi:hypothetical protein